MAAELAEKDNRTANIINALGVLLSFMSFVLVILALRKSDQANQLTKESLENAREAATASAVNNAMLLASAKEANEITSNSIDSQLRPYVGIDYVHPEIILESTKAVEIGIKNFGSTPATGVCLIYDCAFLPDDPENFMETVRDREVGRAISPNHTIPIIFDVSDWTAAMHSLARGVGKLQIHIEVRYWGLEKQRSPAHATIVFRNGRPAIEGLRL